MIIETQKHRRIDGTVVEFKVAKYVPGEEQQIVEHVEALPADKANAVMDHFESQQKTEEETEETEE